MIHVPAGNRVASLGFFGLVRVHGPASGRLAHRVLGRVSDDRGLAGVDSAARRGWAAATAQSMSDGSSLSG